MSLGRGFFVTGTDTGIGKTYVSRLLLEGFTENHTATYMKPVHTGCVRDAQGNLAATDFNCVMKNGAYMSGEMDDHVPYRFELACSPHLAASRCGVTISLEHIRERFARVSDNKSVTIVEGAGGVLTPLSETESMIDLMLHLRLPVVLVVSPRVGTLNHTLLTLETLAKKGIEPAGLVVNNHCGMPEDYIYHDNVRFLKGRVPDAAFLEIGHHGECDDTVRKFCGNLYERL